MQAFRPARHGGPEGPHYKSKNVLREPPERGQQLEAGAAERVLRDADFLVAQAEDNLRRARLDLLTALGRFP